MDNDFHNNGADNEPFLDGLAKITGNPDDYGKFRTPTLRNIEFSAPLCMMEDLQRLKKS